MKENCFSSNSVKQQQQVTLTVQKAKNGKIKTIYLFETDFLDDDIPVKISIEFYYVNQAHNNRKSISNDYKDKLN